MNDEINEIVEHTSRIDGLLKSKIDRAGYGHQNTFAPTGGECWESTVWAIKKDIVDLSSTSISLFDDMAKFYKRVKNSEFLGDFDECVRSRQLLWQLVQLSPFHQVDEGQSFAIEQSFQNSEITNVHSLCNYSYFPVLLHVPESTPIADPKCLRHIATAHCLP